MKKILFIPLYIGEFGWELMVWHSLFRKMKDEGACDEIHAVCFEPFKVLYEDFADVLMFDTPQERATVPKHYLSEEHVSYINELKKENDVVVFDAGFSTAGWNQPRAHKFVSYKKDIEKEYDAVIHFRNMPHRPQDNDSLEWATKLIQKLLSEKKRVALIGTSKGALDIDLPVDKFYDKPLSEVIDVINKSKIVIGQSSGPMHLAALCEAETIVWSNTELEGKREGSREGTHSGIALFERYNSMWNPFKNKVNWLIKPSFEDIIHLVK